MNKQLLKLTKVNNEIRSEPVQDLSKRSAEMISAYLKIRNLYFQLQSVEDTEQAPEVRNALHFAYTNFVQLYGNLGKVRNKNILSLDPYAFYVGSSVEVKVSYNNFEPATILFRSPHGETDEIYKPESVLDAFQHVLGMTGRVDLDKISELCDQEVNEVLRELGDTVYYDPASKTWVTSSEYLSGNVYVKLQIAKDEYEKHKTPEIERSLRAIQEIIPSKVPFELLDFNFGERYIPVSLYTEFCEQFLDCKIKISHFVSADKYKIESVGGYSRKAMNDYFVRGTKSHSTVNGYELLEHAMENTCPKFTYSVGSEDNKVTMIDGDAVQLANDKIETIRNEFTLWLQNLPQEKKDSLVDLYNSLYNCYVIRKYDGSHLSLPGIDLSRLGKNETPIELYPEQKNVAWMIISSKGGIVDIQVGGGKSLCAIIAAHEMKRMKIRNKICLLCLKANVQEMVSTYRKAYPMAKVLAPGEMDFDKSNRVRLFHEMKNNDWDCIIMTHDQFGKIQQDPEMEAEIINEEVEMLEQDLNTLQKCGYQISRGMKKGLEKRKANLEVSLKKMRKNINDKKDEDINFSDIGIDHLLIDEAHKYKNLAFTTRHDRVAGLGNQQGSQKATNMLYAIRTLQKKFGNDLQATFLSGTPISNSLTEMYLLFKYLRPRELKRQHISNFDAWAAVFAKKTTDFEFSVTNQIMAKERFRHFIKVPELALFYNEIAYFRTKKMMGIDEPEMVEELINLPPTEDQQEYIQKLIKFAETGNGAYIDRPPLTDGEKAAKMLIATNLAKKMSTDMRLISPIMYDDHPGNKVNVCAGNVKKFYDSSSEFKGTQLVFCDIGTPGTEGFKLYEELKMKFVWSGIPSKEITFIHSWTERNKHELFKKMNDGGIRVLIGSTDKAGTALNVQQRIVAMHHLDIPWKPSELEQRDGRGVRPGNWAAKLYQDNKVYNFIYATERSLDTYKFTLLRNKQTFISQMKTNELQVRSIDEGSIDEQSGMNFAEYIAVLSGDTTLLEKAKIDKKLAVLEKLKTVHYREISNNKYLLAHKEERLKVVAPMTELLYRDYEQYSSLLQKDETGTKLNPINIFAVQELIKEHEEKWENIKKQRVEIEANEKLEKDEKRFQLRQLKSQEEEVKDAAVLTGEYLIRLFKDWNPAPGQVCEKIGILYGFDLYIERIDQVQREIESEATRSVYGSNSIFYNNKFYVQHPSGGASIKYTFNHGVPNMQNSRICARQFLNSCERIGGLFETYSSEKRNLEKDIDGISKMEQRAFGKESEISFLQGESKRLQMEISQKISSKKEQPVA